MSTKNVLDELPRLLTPKERSDKLDAIARESAARTTRLKEAWRKLEEVVNNPSEKEASPGKLYGLLSVYLPFSLSPAEFEMLKEKAGASGWNLHQSKEISEKDGYKILIVGTS